MRQVGLINTVATKVKKEWKIDCHLFQKSNIVLCFHLVNLLSGREKFYHYSTKFIRVRTLEKSNRNRLNTALVSL